MSKPVGAIDPESGRMVRQYGSLGDAARDNGVQTVSIRGAIKNGTLCAGYKWEYLDFESETGPTGGNSFLTFPRIDTDLWDEEFM